MSSSALTDRVVPRLQRYWRPIASERHISLKDAVVELDERDDGPANQAYLGELTGGTSVPRVFVGGKFIGGGDDTVAKQRSGELRKMLAALGL